VHEDALDRDFIEQYTTGFDEFVSALQAVSWNDIVEQSGVSKQEIEQAAQIFVDSERTRPRAQFAGIFARK